MIEGFCLRCDRAPQDCGCLDYFATTGDPAALICPDIFLYVHTEPIRPDNPVRLLSLRVQIGDRARAVDLRRAESSILAWRDIVTKHRGFDMDSEKWIEDEILRWFEQLGSYKKLARKCNAVIQIHLANYFVYETVLQKTQALMPDAAPEERWEEYCRAAERKDKDGEANVRTWPIGLYMVDYLLSAVNWPSDVRSKNEKRRRINSFVNDGLDATLSGKTWVLPEYPVDRVLAQTCIRRIRARYADETRPTGDRLKAITTLLDDKEWGKWSNNRIAARCGLSHALVNDCSSHIEKFSRSTRAVQRGHQIDTMDMEEIVRLAEASAGDRVSAKPAKVREGCDVNNEPKLNRPPKPTRYKR